MKKIMVFKCEDNACKDCRKQKGLYEEGVAPKPPLHPNCKCKLEEVKYSLGDKYATQPLKPAENVASDEPLKPITKLSPATPSNQNEPAEPIRDPGIPQSLSYVETYERAAEIMQESNSIDHLSSKGLELLLKYETPYDRYFIKDENGRKIGIKPYDAQDGGITVGFGHHITMHAFLTDSKAYDLATRNISIAEAESLLANDAIEFENKVKAMMKRHNIYLTQNEFDALTIQTYNFGNVNHYLQLLKDGNRDYNDWMAVTVERMEPNRKTPNYVGLMNRRYQELDLFFYGDYNGGPDVRKYP